MHAVVMTSAGGPEVLRVEELPDPVIQHDTEILVRLKAAGINPIDTKVRRNPEAHPIDLPAVLGCDGAGVVEAVGAGVKAFKPGDEVYFSRAPTRGHAGTYAQRVVIDERSAARKPASLSFVEAAAAPLVVITSWESLFDRARLQKGQRVLIHAGAGGVGHVAIQLAHYAGATVCTTVSADKVAVVQELGVEKTILYKEEDFVSAVLAWTQGKGVDVVLDTVGGRTFEQSFGAVCVYGDLVTLLLPASEVDWSMARQRNLRISLEVMLAAMYLELEEAQRHQAEILKQCATLFDEKRLEIRVAETFPLAQAAEAHRRLEAGSMTGKLVLMID